MVGSFSGNPLRMKIHYRTDIPVPPARQRFDVARRLRRIAKRFANPGDCIVQAVVKIDERVRGPNSGLKFLAGHNIAGTFQQDLEHLQRLATQAQP